MALSTYSELQTTIADWLFGDTTVPAADLIALFEAHANRTLRTRQMEARKTAHVTDQYVALPDDFLEMRNFQIGANPVHRLKFIAPAAADDVRFRRHDTTGTPSWFTIIGNHIELLPTPHAEFELEMTYYARITPLSDDAPTNWLLEIAPDAYLYGALLQAAPYLHEDERVPMWKAGMDEVLEQLRRNDEAARYGAGPLTMRRRRSYS